MNVRSIAMAAAALAAAVTALSIPAGGRALPLPASAASTPGATPVTAVAHREKVRRYRHPFYGPQAYRVVPRSDPQCPGLYSWNPANPDRGFCDPGFAYHGNVNGCAIDEGYGRWSPCDHLK